MTSTEVSRLFVLLDDLRKESRASLAEVRDEVQGYRADLNGRLRALEEAEAKRQGGAQKLGNIGRLVVGVAAVSASIGSVVGITMAVV